jgi:hypothetical protein
MIHSRLTAVLANVAPAIGWALFLFTGALSSVWSIVFVACFFVVAVANVVVLLGAANPPSSAMEMVTACLILADGLGFVLWSPALFLLAQTPDGSPAAGVGYLVLLGLLSAAGFALGAKTLVRSGASANAG